MPTPIPYQIDNLGRDAQDVVIGGGAATIYSYNITNFNKFQVYLKFYDKLAVNVNPAVDVPAQTLTIPARVGTTPGRLNNSNVNIVFTTGLAVRCTSGSANADTQAVALGTVQMDIDSAGGGGGSGTVTGSGLTVGNVMLGAGTSAIQDSGVDLGSIALVSQLPTNLSQLGINDHSIFRYKIDFTAASTLASVTSGSTATLVPGRIYYGDVGSNLTIAFSPAPTQADAPILVYAHFTAPVTLTVPTLVRNADNGSSVSVSVLAAQYALLQFSKDGAGNVRLLDNILLSGDFRIIAGSFYNNGNVLATGSTFDVHTVDYNGNITGWNISVDQGTATFKVWKKADGTAIPTSADSINTSGVSISTGTHLRSSTLSDFTTTTVTAGDMFIVQLSAVSSATIARFELELKPA